MRYLRTSALVLLAALLAACGSSVNQENYGKIEEGMSLAEVEAILGKARESESIGVGSLSGTAAVWREEKSGATIRAQFINDRLRGKQFTQ